MLTDRQEIRLRDYANGRVLTQRLHWYSQFSFGVCFPVLDGTFGCISEPSNAE